MLAHEAIQSGCPAMNFFFFFFFKKKLHYKDNQIHHDPVKDLGKDFSLNRWPRIQMGKSESQQALRELNKASLAKIWATPFKALLTCTKEEEPNPLISCKILSVMWPAVDKCGSGELISVTTREESPSKITSLNFKNLPRKTAWRAARDSAILESPFTNRQIHLAQIHFCRTCRTLEKIGFSCGH